MPLNPIYTPEFNFKAFLNGELTPGEESAFYEWLNASSAHRDLFEAYREQHHQELRSAHPLDTNDHLTQVWEKIHKRRDHKLRRKIGLIGVAVAATVVLSLTVFIPDTMPRHLDSQIRITADLGERKHITLPDGSQLWLNAGSELIYDAVDKDSIRHVELQGEAYFEIVRDTLRPFVVTTETVNIRVLGTKFNVNSFNEDHKVETTVIDGCVAVASRSNNVILTRNDRVVYNKINDSFVKSEVDADSYIRWLKGIISFHGETLSEIASKLERQFDVKIIIEGSDFKNYTFTGTFDSSFTVEKILNVFAQTYPFQYTVNDKTITLKCD